MDHHTTENLLAVYALNALDADEELAVEMHLATCATCTREVVRLRTAAGELGSMTAQPPPPNLRAVTLNAALERRREARTPPAYPFDVHRIEAERLTTLVTSLAADDWDRSVGDPFPGWTVHDLVAHLAATENLLACLLGAETSGADSATRAEVRTERAVARHRSLDPTHALTEFDQAAHAVSRAVRAQLAIRPTPTLLWADAELPVDVVLTHRAFEIWTHADDIRAALGHDLLPPPAASLATMSRTVLVSLPAMLASTGADHPGAVAEIHLVGPGGGAFTIILGADGGVVPFHTKPDLRLEIGVVDFCRVIGDRKRHDLIDYRAIGDDGLASDLLRSLPSLAIL